MIWSKSLVRHWVYGAISLTLVACSSAPLPETKAAISSLKGLNSKLNVGINRGEYADALQDTEVSVDRAIETDPKSKNNPVIKKAMDGHLAALGLWRCSTEDSEDDFFAQDKCRKNIYETVIFPLYPEIKEKLEPLKQTRSDSYIYSADHDEVIQFLWKSSQTELTSLISN